MVPLVCCAKFFKRSFLNPQTAGGKYPLVLHVAAQLTMTDSRPRCWDNDGNNTGTTPIPVVKGFIKQFPYGISLRYVTNYMHSYFASRFQAVNV